MRFGGGGGVFAFQGVECGVPTKGGAFDSGRESVDAGECGDVADFLGLLARCHDFVKFIKEGLGFGGGFSFELGSHQRGTGLRDGTTGTVEGDFADLVPVEVEIDAALIAAGGIVSMGYPAGRGQLAAIARPAIVVEDDLLI